MHSRRPRVFISHASADAVTAHAVEALLGEQGIDAWLDQSDIRAGQLLRVELQTSIASARVVVLLWSRAAACSRWVRAELLTAYHENRFVVLCCLDAAPWPDFLQRSIAIDMRRHPGGWQESLVRAVRQAPASRNPVPRRLTGCNVELDAAIHVAHEAQALVTRSLAQGDRAKAAQAQASADPLIALMRSTWPLDAMVLNLRGYHEKNRYMVRHWPAIQAGRPPTNALLLRAERCFFDALLVDPDDHSALNGLANVLIFERDFDTAEFFCRRAIALARRDGQRYPEAEHDLALIRRAR